jgi:hypothetical protein
MSLNNGSVQIYKEHNMNVKINQLCAPKKPTATESRASCCLRALLEGHILNRKNLDQVNIEMSHASLNSLISDLRNNMLIPIESKAQLDGTSNYSIKPEEIIRYKDQNLRSYQLEEMRVIVENKRLSRMTKSFIKFLSKLNEHPNLWQYFEELPSELEAIFKELNALLISKKSVTK